MVEKLQELDGEYRFLISSDGKRLVIGTPSDVNNPNHQEIAEALGLNPQQVKGGYVDIWEKGKQMVYCRGSFSVPKATEEEFEDARKGEIIIFQP